MDHTREPKERSVMVRTQRPPWVASLLRGQRKQGLPKTRMGLDTGSRPTSRPPSRVGPWVWSTGAARLPPLFTAPITTTHIKTRGTAGRTSARRQGSAYRRAGSRFTRRRMGTCGVTGVDVSRLRVSYLYVTGGQNSCCYCSVAKLFASPGQSLEDRGREESRTGRVPR